MIQYQSFRSSKISLHFSRQLTMAVITMNKIVVLTFQSKNLIFNSGLQCRVLLQVKENKPLLFKSASIRQTLLNAKENSSVTENQLIQILEIRILSK